MDFDSLPKVKYTKDMVVNGKCLIDGEDYPAFIGKIVDMLRDGTQPRLLLLGDPGHGKTFAAGRLAEILHNELDVLEGEFNPEEQITMDPIKWSKSVRSQRHKIFLAPDADAIWPSGDHRTTKNQNNRKILDQSRIFSNILVYDAHEKWRLDKGIRTSHNIRFVSKGKGDNYEFKVFRILRENDSDREEVEKLSLGTWKFNKPSDETAERIKELDEEEKVENIVRSEDDMKLKRKKKEMKAQAFS